MALTAHQRFSVERVWRHVLMPHPKNPRTIDPKAQKRLKEKLQSVGLLDAIVWNRRTGFVLSGHQRLAILDRLEHYDPETRENDYELDVAVVDVDVRVELEMLAFFNNPSAQGTFDTELLAELNLEYGVGFEAMGFDQLDVDLLFAGDSRFAEAFADVPEVKKVKGTLQAIKEDRARMDDRLREENKADFYLVVVARDQAELDEVRRRLAVEHTAQFASAEALFAALDGYGGGRAP